MATIPCPLAAELFIEWELVELTLVIIAINGWNRLAIALRTEVGSYQAKPVA